MFENQINPAQFNTFQTSAFSTVTSAVDNTQGLTENIKLRGELIVLDNTQKLVLKNIAKFKKKKTKYI